MGADVAKHCTFCKEARKSLDTKMETALASIDKSMTALDTLHTSMEDAKWGRRKNPDRENQGPANRAINRTA